MCSPRSLTAAVDLRRVTQAVVTCGSRSAVVECTSAAMTAGLRSQDARMGMCSRVDDRAECAQEICASWLPSEDELRHV